MKILILGLSGSGKSTIAPKIADKYKLRLIEADDEVEKYNGGVWPDSDEIITKVFDITDKNVINYDDIVYVTSWMKRDLIKKFYNKGFLIIEVHASFEELVKRKTKRDNITQEKVDKFKNTYKEYFDEISNKEMIQMYRTSIDSTNLSTEEILLSIYKNI